MRYSRDEGGERGEWEVWKGEVQAFHQALLLISLVGCDIGTKGVEFIAQILSGNSTLQEINLSGTYCSLSFSASCSPLASVLYTLLSLLLSPIHPSPIHPSPIYLPPPTLLSHIPDFVIPILWMQIFYIVGNKIDSIAPSIVTALQVNSALRRIDLSRNTSLSSS